MIKFFQKIRQKLLSENKLSKYLIYAIGEIVVIGILIDLQINNWNSNRIDRKNEELYLKNIESDLVIQKSIIENQLIFESDILRVTGDILKNFNQNKEVEIDSTFDKKIGILSGRMTFTKHNPTYDELLSTGNLGLIKNRDLKEKLLLFYQSSDRLETILSKNNDFIDDHFIPDLIGLVETDYGSVFKMESFKDVFENNKALIESNFIIADDMDLLEISNKQFANPSNKLIFINHLTNRNRVALVNYIFIKELNENLESLLKFL